MSDNSSTSNNSDILKKKNVSYTTDYMVEYLKDSGKAPTNDKSEESNFDNYVNENKYTSDNKH